MLNVTQQAFHKQSGIASHGFPTTLFSIDTPQRLYEMLRSGSVKRVKVLQESPGDVPMHDEEHTKKRQARGAKDCKKQFMGNTYSHFITQPILNYAPYASIVQRLPKKMACPPMFAPEFLISATFLPHLAGILCPRQGWTREPSV
jgi:hypothetical protein